MGLMAWISHYILCSYKTAAAAAAAGPRLPSPLPKLPPTRHTHPRRFLCLFCTSLPSETTARVLDALFNEGAKILFRVSLALLTCLQQQLLACDNQGVGMRMMGGGRGVW